MPIYVYRCPVCGDQFERQQSFHDKPVETCPAGHSGVKRVFTPAGIVFKGSGWYITDSRNGRSGSIGNGKSHKSEVTSESKTETKSEAKSEATSES